MEYVLKYTDSTGGVYTYKLSDARENSTSLCVNTDDGIKYAPLTNDPNELDSTQKLRVQYNDSAYRLRLHPEPIVLMPANMTSPTGILTSDKGSLGLYGTGHGSSEWLTWSTYDKIPAISGTSGGIDSYTKSGRTSSSAMYWEDALALYVKDHTHSIVYTNGITCATKTDSASNYSAIGLKAYEKADYVPSGAYIFVKINNTAFDSIGTLQAFDNKSIYINPSSNEFQINSDKGGLPYDLTVSYSFTPSIRELDTDAGSIYNKSENVVDGFYPYYWHNHNGNSVTVSLSNRPNILRFKGMTLMVYQLSQNISFNDLPSGSGMFFKTSILPIGWTLDTNQDLPIILGNSYSVINNSSLVTSASTTATTTTSPSSWGRTMGWAIGSGSSFYYWRDHKHSIPSKTFNLTTYLSSISYSVGWYLAWKQ